jgi:hypothetical protein
MEKHEVFKYLETYLIKLTTFFSLNSGSSKREIYSSFRNFIKSFDAFNSETSASVIKYLQICYNPLGEVSKISGEFAKKDLQIKSKTELERIFTDSVLLYLSTLSITYFQLYDETVKYLKDYIDGSEHIKKFKKIQNRMKLWLLLGILSIPFAFLGLIPEIAIIIAVLSVILFVFDRFVLSIKEIDKLKQVGKGLHDNGLQSLEKMILTQKKMVFASEFITSKKHFISSELLVVFDKLLAGQTLTSDEFAFYSEELTKSRTLFIAQFEKI